MSDVRAAPVIGRSESLHTTATFLIRVRHEGYARLSW
jgi:hypothetical protein